MLNAQETRDLEAKYVGKRFRAVGPFLPEGFGYQEQGVVVRLVSAHNGDTVESADDDLWIVQMDNREELSVLYSAEMAQVYAAEPLIPEHAFKDRSLYQ